MGNMQLKLVKKLEDLTKRISELVSYKESRDDLPSFYYPESGKELLTKQDLVDLIDHIDSIKNELEDCIKLVEEEKANQFSIQSEVIKCLDELKLGSRELTEHLLKNSYTTRIDASGIYNKGYEIVKRISERFKKIMEEQGAYHVDNFRVAIKGNDLLEAMYQEERESGCCGSRDEECEIGELVFKLGFNYGH